MRRRLRAASAVTAAIALGGLGSPLAQADLGSAAGKRACVTDITRMAMNEPDLFVGSEPIVVGVTAVTTTTLRVYVRNTVGCLRPSEVTADLYHGRDLLPRFPLGRLVYRSLVDDNLIYEGTVYWNPATMDNLDYPGVWTARTTAGGYTTDRASGTFLVQRRAVLTINAAPEPVSKGGKLKVSGVLLRASWDTKRYVRYPQRPVALQFRSPPAGYLPVRTITGDIHGRIATTVTASTDGCYRYSFRANSTTSPAIAVPDCVDVR